METETGECFNNTGRLTGRQQVQGFKASVQRSGSLFRKENQPDFYLLL